MAAHVSVTVSGPALSFLMYENVKSYGDQEGFLLGEIISHVTDTISDSQIRGEKMETLISINSVMPIPYSVSFYNGIGRVNQEKMKSFLKDKAKEVIGWYNFRRNASLVPHFRDRVLHKEMSAAIPHVSPEHFTMCLLNTAVSSGGSTHIFNHKFMRYRHSKYEALPMQIQNLGETQPDYKLVPSTACLSESFNSITASLKVKHDNGSDASLVCDMQRALQEHLWTLIADVERSERQVAELEKEVTLLCSQPGAIPNEILLPQLLREEVSNINKLELSVSEMDNSSRPTDNHLAAEKIQGTLNFSAERSSLVEEESGGDRPSDPEPFAYVTEMKLEMSQPRVQVSPSTSSTSSTTSPAIAANNNNNNNRRERGRGTGRGAGRSTRRSPQFRAGNSPEAFPNLRRAENVTTSPVRGGQANNRSVKQRSGYAQAVKRPGNAVDSPKPTTRSQASNGANSQEY